MCVSQAITTNTAQSPNFVILSQHDDRSRCFFHSILCAHNGERFYTLCHAQPRSTTRGRALQLEGVRHKNYQGNMRSIAFPSSYLRWQSQRKELETCMKAKKRHPFPFTSLGTPAEFQQKHGLRCCFYTSIHAIRLFSTFPPIILYATTPMQRPYNIYGRMQKLLPLFLSCC